MCVLTACVAFGTFPSLEMYGGSIVFGPAARWVEVALAVHSVFICSQIVGTKKFLQHTADCDEVSRFVRSQVYVADGASCGLRCT